MQSRDLTIGSRPEPVPSIPTPSVCITCIFDNYSLQPTPCPSSPAPSAGAAEMSTRSPRPGGAHGLSRGLLCSGVQSTARRVAPRTEWDTESLSAQCQLPAASLPRKRDALPVEWKGEQRDAAEVGLAIKQESEV